MFPCLYLESYTSQSLLFTQHDVHADPYDSPSPSPPPQQAVVAADSEVDQLSALNILLMCKNAELQGELDRLVAHNNRPFCCANPRPTKRGGVVGWMAMDTSSSRPAEAFNVIMMTGTPRAPQTCSQVRVVPSMTVHELKSVYLDDTFKSGDKSAALETMCLRLDGEDMIIPQCDYATLKENGLRQGSKLWVSFERVPRDQ